MMVLDFFFDPGLPVAARAELAPGLRVLVLVESALVGALRGGVTGALSLTLEAELTVGLAIRAKKLSSTSRSFLVTG
jgi:hypothetical protein